MNISNGLMPAIVVTSALFLPVWYYANKTGMTPWRKSQLRAGGVVFFILSLYGVLSFAGSGRAPAVLLVMAALVAAAAVRLEWVIRRLDRAQKNPAISDGVPGV